MDEARLLAQHPTVAATLLLNAVLESWIDGERVQIRLTEVEAYGGVAEDPGSHSYRRMTPRNATMFGRPGLAYVYFTYGMHWCLNVVAHQPGTAGAVLLRAGEVVEGIDVARRRRARSSDRDLARGPARLTRALGVSGDCDGVDLLDPDSPVRLASALGARPRSPHEPWAVSARTGVSGAGALTPWRFFLPGEPSVSPYRASARRARS